MHESEPGASTDLLLCRRVHLDPPCRRPSFAPGATQQRHHAAESAGPDYSFRARAIVRVRTRFDDQTRLSAPRPAVSLCAGRASLPPFAASRPDRNADGLEIPAFRAFGRWVGEYRSVTEAGLATPTTARSTVGSRLTPSRRRCPLLQRLVAAGLLGRKSRSRSPQLAVTKIPR